MEREGRGVGWYEGFVFVNWNLILSTKDEESKYRSKDYDENINKRKISKSFSTNSMYFKSINTYYNFLIFDYINLEKFPISKISTSSLN